MKGFATMAAAALGVLLAAGSPAVAGGRPLRVVTSIPPLAMLASQVGGDRVEVRSLLAAGADPHTWEPRPSDAAALQDADVVISLGSPMDDWLGDTIRAREGSVVVKLDERTGGHDDEAGEEEGNDPHVWLDPWWVRGHALALVEKALATADPDDRAAFATRAAATSAEIAAVEESIRARLSAAPTRTYLAWHPAWGCFASRFGLVSAGHLGESEGREPSLKAMVEAVEAGRRAGVQAVLVEPQEDDRHARVLAGELHVDVVTVDPLGDLRSEDRATYAALMRFNGEAFARALGVR